MRRRSLLAGAMAAPLMAACSNPGSETTAPAGAASSHRGRTTITYGMWDQAQLPGMQKIIKAFEAENPDVAVTVQLTPWSSYWTSLKTSMRGGTAPDVFWMNAVNIQLYASNGVLEPLDPYLRGAKGGAKSTAKSTTESGAQGGADVTSKHPAALVQLYSYGGRHYGIPKDFDTVGLWYNKRLFDKAGIDYPDETWTWDTARRAAKELTDPRELVYGMASDIDRQSKFYPSIFGAGGWVIKGDRSGFGDPRSIEGLRYWTDMIDQGWAPSQSVVAETTARNMFLSGKCAMNYDLSAMAGIYHADPVMKDEAGVAVLPLGRRRATVIHGLGNVMSAKSRNKDAAWRFIEFMAGRKAAEIQAAGGVTISSYTGTQETWIKSMPNYDLRVFIDMLPYAVPYPRSRNTPVWENLEVEMLGAPFSGKGGTAGAARGLAKAMDQALAEEAKS